MSLPNGIPVRKPEWQNRPRLAQLLLGYRKARGLKLTEVANEIAASLPGVPASTIFEDIHRFEEGRPEACLSRQVFERLVDLLGVDLDVVRRTIGERRIEDEKEFEEFVQQPNRIVLGFESRSPFGWQKIFPTGMAFDEAMDVASNRSRIGPCVVRCYWDGTLHFFRDGELLESTTLVGHSAYPFARVLSRTPVDDGWGSRGPARVPDSE